MISKTEAGFWRCFEVLPAAVQRQARERFRLWQTDAFNHALYFKSLSGAVWSMRVNQQYRVLGRRQGNLIVWFWIGSHADYGQLLKRLR